MLNVKALAKLIVAVSLLMVWSVTVSVACPMAENVPSAVIMSGDMACCANSEDGNLETDLTCEAVLVCSQQMPNIEARNDTAAGSIILSTIDWPVCNASILARLDPAPPGYPPRS